MQHYWKTMMTMCPTPQLRDGSRTLWYFWAVFHKDLNEDIMNNQSLFSITTVEKRDKEWERQKKVGKPVLMGSISNETCTILFGSSSRPSSFCHLTVNMLTQTQHTECHSHQSSYRTASLVLKHIYALALWTPCPYIQYAA